MSLLRSIHLTICVSVQQSCFPDSWPTDNIYHPFQHQFWYPVISLTFRTWNLEAVMLAHHQVSVLVSSTRCSKGCWSFLPACRRHCSPKPCKLFKPNLNLFLYKITDYWFVTLLFLSQEAPASLIILCSITYRGPESSAEWVLSRIRLHPGTLAMTQTVTKHVFFADGRLQTLMWQGWELVFGHGYQSVT